MKERVRKLWVFGAAILDYIDALERSNTEMHGIMIMRHGKICARGWWQPFAPNLRHGLRRTEKCMRPTAVEHCLYGRRIEIG